MALVVFLRGVNVGGSKTFRPSVLAGELAAYDVVNVGAAGTFVVRKPGSRGRFTAALRSRLPFEAEIITCDGADVMRIEHPFDAEPPSKEIVRFVSVLPRRSRVELSLPMALPATGEWFVRVLAADHPFIFGIYRRHMKTITYLGQLDRLFGERVTTRNWNTIRSVVRLLEP